MEGIHHERQQVRNRGDEFAFAIWGVIDILDEYKSEADQMIRTAAVQLPIEGTFPTLSGANEWLNSPPLTAAAPYAEKSYSSTSGPIPASIGCVPCHTSVHGPKNIRIKDWSSIGVHTPEFPFEHNLDNVRHEVKDMAVDYPVAVDSDYAIWSAFDNHYWPALYIIDAQGPIRHHVFGEGDYDQSEKIIQKQLLTEAGSKNVSNELVTVDTEGLEVAADWATCSLQKTMLAMTVPRTLLFLMVPYWMSLVFTMHLDGCRSISGHFPVIGQSVDSLLR